MRCAQLAMAAVLAFVIIGALQPSARAWSNGGYSADPANPDYGTHDWIADQALTTQTRDVAFLSTTYHSQYMLGTEAPDNPDYIGDTTKHHVYFYASGVAEDDASAVRASQMYDIALGYLRQGDFHSASYDIGVMTHYVSDVGVFGHTMGAYTDWGAEVHHSDYENAIESRLDSLALPPGVQLGNSTAYDATMGLARDITFGTGDIKPNVWMDSHYSWSDPVFEGSAKASIYRSVAGVAAIIEHLLAEATPAPSPPGPSPRPSPVPEIPHQVASLNAAVRGATIMLSWTAPQDDGHSPITGYLIFRGTNVADRVVLSSVSNSTFTWMDSTATRGITYSYWVIAINAVGQAEMLSTVTARIPEGMSQLFLAAIISTISGGAAAGGFIAWRSRTRRRD